MMGKSYQRRCRFGLAPIVAMILVGETLAIPCWARAASSSSSPAAASDDNAGKLAEADRHFRRGVDLYEDGDMVAAQVEFARAYDIIPSYKILYNLAQVAYRRQDYVRALEHFRRYLADGRDGISAERHRQVDEDVRRLEQRIGQIVIDVQADDSGAEIRVDDLPVATAPLLAPITANVGTRRVDLVRPTGERQRRLIDVVGGETAHLRFPRTVVQLTPDQATLARHAVDSDTPSSLVDGPASPESAARSTGRAWIGWSVAAMLASGAALTGVLAYSSARDLQQRRDDYPLAPGELDAMSRRANVLAFTTDGLLAGAALAAALSLYLTLHHPSQLKTATEVSSTSGGADGLSATATHRQRRQQ